MITVIQITKHINYSLDFPKQLSQYHNAFIAEHLFCGPKSPVFTSLFTSLSSVFSPMERKEEWESSQVQ